MPGEKGFTPLQRNQSEVDKQNDRKAFEQLKVGDIIHTDDGARLITQADTKNHRFRAEPVKFDGGKWKEDISRSTRVLNENEVKLIKRDVNTLEMNKLIYESQLKHPEQLNPEAEKNKKELSKSHPVSFSVVVNGSPDGYVAGGNSYEYIVHGKTEYGRTASGTAYKADIATGAVSAASLRAIATAIVNSRDYTNEGLDERKAYDDIQDIFNQDPSIETITVEGGATINRDELGIEQSVPNGLEENFDPLNPDGIIEDAITFNTGLAPDDQDVSLDDILNDISKEQNDRAKAYREEHQNLNESFIEADDPGIDEGFEPGDEPWNNPWLDD